MPYHNGRYFIKERWSPGALVFFVLFFIIPLFALNAEFGYFRDVEISYEAKLSFFIFWLFSVFGAVFGVPLIPKAHMGNLYRKRPSKFFILFAVLFIFISSFSTLFYIIHYGLSPILRSELVFEGIAQVIPLQGYLTNVAYSIVLYLFMYSLVYSKNFKLTFFAILLIFLSGLSTLARSTFLPPLFIFIFLWFSQFNFLSVRKIVILALITVFLSISISFLQFRSPGANAINLLIGTFNSFTRYFSYPFYLFDLALPEVSGINPLYSFFGAPIGKIIQFFDPKFIEFQTTFFIKMFDLGVYFNGTKWIPANVFHSWPFMLFSGGGWVLVAIGGFVNGFLPSVFARKVGPITYVAVIYFITFSSFFKFPFARLSLFVLLAIFILFEKSVFRRMLRR